jgi:hypothetical protein
MADEDFRVEVELDDEEHGYSTEERLRAADLDDEARERLGSSIMVTRDGSRLFLYAANVLAAREAERVARRLVEAEELTADIRVTRWHPIEEEWKDASLPLPATPAEEEAEYGAREAAEEAEAEREGTYDWHVAVHLLGRSAAAELAARLGEEGLQVRRRWRYVTVGLPTEERAEELAERLASELPEGTDVRVEVDLSDVAHSPLQFLPF